MTTPVAPMEALKRLRDIVSQLDAAECPALYNQIQGELAVAEMVLRDAAPVAQPAQQVEAVGRDHKPPKHWRQALRDINTETFGQYSEEVARIAIDCCVDVLDELEADSPQLEAQQAGDVAPVELAGVHEQITEGAGFWHPCSGCHETEDGHPVGRYPYSNFFKCQLGNGCSECGGIGAVWDNIDYEEMAKEKA